MNTPPTIPNGDSLYQMILDSAASYSHNNFLVGVTKDEIDTARNELVKEGLIEPKTIFVLTEKGKDIKRAMK